MLMLSIPDRTTLLRIWEIGEMQFRKYRTTDKPPR